MPRDFGLVKVKLVVDMTDDTSKALVGLKRCLEELHEDQPWNDMVSEALEQLGEIEISAHQV